MLQLVVEVGSQQGNWWDHLMEEVHTRPLGITRPTDKSERD